MLLRPSFMKRLVLFTGQLVVMTSLCAFIGTNTYAQNNTPPAQDQNALRQAKLKELKAKYNVGKPGSTAGVGDLKVSRGDSACLDRADSLTRLCLASGGFAPNLLVARSLARAARRACRCRL